MKKTTGSSLRFITSGLKTAKSTLSKAIFLSIATLALSSATAHAAEEFKITATIKHDAGGNHIEFSNTATKAILAVSPTNFAIYPDMATGWAEAHFDAPLQCTKFLWEQEKCRWKAEKTEKDYQDRIDREKRVRAESCARNGVACSAETGFIRKALLDQNVDINKANQ